jgi:predicted dehydrogenase
MSSEAPQPPLGIGLVGCGDIAGEYVRTLRGFPGLSIRRVAARRFEAARAFGRRWAIEPGTVADILGDPAVRLIVNLTVPRAHAEITRAALQSGRHVYSEKPLGVSYTEATELCAIADRLGLTLCTAPDTFLGAGHQLCRRLVDSGEIGTVLGGTAVFVTGGPEARHPSPAFFYKKGGGPVKDVGPYYLSCLMNMLGPVVRVSSALGPAQPERTWRTPTGQRRSVTVQVPTHVSAVLTFANGAAVTLTLSYEMSGLRAQTLELYGSAGSIRCPDPVFFGGPVHVKRSASDWTTIQPELPFGSPRHRGLGAAEMVRAISSGSPPRNSAGFGLHVMEVLDALEVGGTHEIMTRLDRMEMMSYENL